jgi:signal transduction histidine kinase
MKKTAFFILVNLFSLTALLCQTLSKEETLNYIQRIYRKTNCFYLSTSEYNGSNSSYMNFPVGIDQVELEFDQLIIHYNIPGEYNAYSGPRSASISGELILDEENNGIKNADGDWVLRTQPGNSAELKKLYYALKDLQFHVEDDPYAQKVSQYEREKSQRQAEERKLQEEQQRKNDQERARLARESAERTRYEQEQRRRAEEQRRLEEERRSQEAIRDAQRIMNQSIYGGGNM